MSLGESILDHYELFLGKYIGVDKYTSGEYVIQLLGFDRTFKDSHLWDCQIIRI